MYQSRIRSHKNRNHRDKKRELLEPDEEQEYGIVQDLLGNGRVRVICDNKEQKIARIRGSMRKYAGKVLIEKGDLVIVAKREFGDDKVDLVHKYHRDEISALVRHHLLPEGIVKALTSVDSFEDQEKQAGNDYVVFVGSEDEAEASASVLEEELDIDAI
jgi:translation initiation factor 1A